MATVIDGKAAARRLRERVAGAVAGLKDEHGIQPGLAVVLVGEDPASRIYVRNKGRQTLEVGMRSFAHQLAATVTEGELLALVEALNDDPAVDGILVQLPLPEHIGAQRVIETIDPAKDVDGFHPMNTGALANGDPRALVPCTPLGCLMMLQEQFPEGLSGKDAVVIGRSNIVGKPMAQLLLQQSCTVSIAHSRTRDLPALCRRADILVAAVGRPEMVRGDWVKPGAVVIDVGINRVAAPGPGFAQDPGPPSTQSSTERSTQSSTERSTQPFTQEGSTQKNKGHLLGDVAYAEAARRAAAITPVPGGVGPMTIACLLRNTVVAACRQRGVACAL